MRSFNFDFRISDFGFSIRNLVSAIVVLVIGASPTFAQTKLLDREPFDRVILKRSSGGDVLDVRPLELPRRPLANLPTQGRLALELVDRPDERYDVSWTSVAEVRVFEQLLIDEAERLTAEGQFDEAYEYFSQLSAKYPNFPNLNAAVNAYLRRNALALHQSQQDERALALLVTLVERSPNDSALPNAVEVVAGEIIQGYLRNQNYAAARGVLDLWQTKFHDVAKPSAQAWQERFEAAADRQVSEARRLMDEKQFIDARKAAQRAIAIWPKHVRAAETLSQIQREFSFIAVGVFEASPQQPVPRMDSWPSLRASRLVSRQLVEPVGFGAEGGEYRSPLGDLTLDESGLVLRWKLAEGGSPIAADVLARYLLSMAEPGNPLFRAELADMLAGVSIADGNVIELHLKHPHVRPEALLQLSPPAPSESNGVKGNSSITAPYAVSSFLPTEAMYTATTATGPLGTSNRPRAGQLQLIVEQLMPDDDAAIAALMAGDIDVLDHVPPWQARRLRGAAGVRIGAYRLPTVHVLIPNPKCELAKKREFRRALCYGIDRSWVVQRVLLGGVNQSGFDVLSGPFPAGTSLSDPIRYGYNNQIAPRPFEPRLAAILASVAWSNVQKEKGDSEKEKSDGEPVGELPTLVLAHPSDPLSRMASQLIQAQLKREGIPIELREYTANELLAGRVEYDLRYAELAAWEPITDARRILGTGGLVGDAASQQVLSALSRLDEATNWKDVRARMGELHEITHHNLPLIPLWQTVNFFAYRDTVAGIGEAPMTLYQNVEEWRIVPARNVAQTDK